MDEVQGLRVPVLANRMLVGVAATIAAAWEKFTGWLVTGLAAALALIIANLDKAKDMLPAASVSLALKIFVVILVVHTMQKVLAIVVASAAAAEEKQLIQNTVPPLEREEAMGLLDHLEDAYFFPFSCMIHGMFRRLRKGEFVHLGRRVVRFALASTLLAGVQICLAVWMLWVIARGLP